jgi:hypothetical protein
MASRTRAARPVTNRFFSGLVITGSCFAITGSIATALPRPFRIELLPPAIIACAVASPEPSLLVSVYNDSTDFTRANQIESGRSTELSFLGQDRVTRLCFFQNPKPASGQSSVWAASFSDRSEKELRAITDTGAFPCRFDKWVTQVGDKVLPLSLLSITFHGKIPPPGTPLVDADGKIVGLVLQPGSGNTGYAIPCQAVHRVVSDIVNHRKLVRGWMGLALSTSSQVPRITGIIPGSPAATAGLRENDILTRAGSFATERYPDAVNALFYSIPGKATSLEVLRGNERIQCKVTPIAK